MNSKLIVSEDKIEAQKQINTWDDKIASLKMDKKLKESIQDKINFSEEFCRFSKTKLSLLNYSLFRDDKYRELYNKYIDKCYKLNLFRRNSQDTVLFST